MARQNGAGASEPYSGIILEILQILQILLMRWNSPWQATSASVRQSPFSAGISLARFYLHRSPSRCGCVNRIGDFLNDECLFQTCHRLPIFTDGGGEVG